MIRIFITYVAVLGFYADANFQTGTRKAREDQLLSQVVMISTHDAMTGEMIPERDHILERWTNTQNATLLQQLDCGARAFDYRPFLAEDGILYAHHGPSVIYKRMEDTMISLLEWGKKNPSELVVLDLSHCVTERFHNNYYADDCYDAVVSLLHKLQIPLIEDCSQLSTLTYSQALNRSRVLGIVNSCTWGYWDPSLTCYGVTDGVEYVCHPTANKPTGDTLPWMNIEAFWKQNTAYDPTLSGDSRMWSIGGNWQSSVQSVVIGTLHNSSLILTESRSQINKRVAALIRAGGMPYLNLLGLDNVCDGGLEVKAAMDQYFYSSSQDKQQGISE